MEQTGENTDIEIWRKIPDDYYSPAIHVTKRGDIGINVGGYVWVAPVEQWFDALNTRTPRAGLTQRRGHMETQTLLDALRAWDRPGSLQFAYHPDSKYPWRLGWRMYRGIRRIGKDIEWAGRPDHDEIWDSIDKLRQQYDETEARLDKYEQEGG